MTQLQLNPSIPMYSIDHDSPCEAFMVLDYGKEDDLLFVCAMDKTGEIWIVPNSKLRFLNNYSIGRKYSVHSEQSEE